MRFRLATVALLAAVFGSVQTASAQAPVRILESDPYYLSLHQAEQPARGTVLLLHGGGWRGGLGAAADELMSAWIDPLQDWGYDVANLGYRSGASGLRDAEDALRLLRKRLGPDEPICIYGASAGAQLGLMVAARHGAEVDCVVDLLGPPDLERFGSKAKSQGGEFLATQAFGAERLAALSPVNNVERIRSPVLVAAAPCDEYIELSTQRAFVRALNEAGGDAELAVIESGDDMDLEHCEVDQASFEEFEAATRSFLGAVAPAPEGDEPAVDLDEDSGTSVWLLLAAAALVACGVAMFVRALRH